MAKNRKSYTLDDVESGVLSLLPGWSGMKASKEGRLLLNKIDELLSQKKKEELTKEELKLRIPIKEIKAVLQKDKPISDEEIEEQVLAIICADEIQDYTFINLVDTIQYTDDIRKCITTANKSLANKYLYLGAHGAGAWQNVEEVLGLKIEASSLLRDNLDHILQVATNNGSDSLDIVSLGSGTGGDDVEILKAIQKRYAPANTSYFAIDISVDLLRLGIGKVIKRMNSYGYSSNMNFHGICVDIDEIVRIKTYLSTNAEKKKKKLFHLLGLTLGNNKEFDFLKGISRTMEKGDLLLLGLDFCVDDEEEFERTFNSYKEAESQVFEFLSGPLKMATMVNASPRSSLVKLEGYWKEDDKYDYLKNGFSFHIGVEDGHQRSLSNIPETKTIARYYTEYNSSTFDINRAKLCDISNKYKSVSFKNWLETQTDQLRLEIIGSLTEWKRGGQHLVLLRRL